MKTFRMTRRSFMASASAGLSISPRVFAASSDAATTEFLPPSTLFAKPPTDALWDTWVLHHHQRFFLYYMMLDKAFTKGLGIGLFTSRDGVHWSHHGKLEGIGSDGGTWPAVTSDGEPQEFIMPTGSDKAGGDGIRKAKRSGFAKSHDLIHWTRLGAEFDFKQDLDMYEGRFDGAAIWPVRRPDGSYFGYFTAYPKGNEPGFGFAESHDGRQWKVLKPAILSNLELGPPNARSPEVCAVYLRDGRFYAFAGLDDLKPQVNEDFTDFRPGITVFVSDNPGGPFRPAAKNRRVLVGNASYWLRFVDTPEGVLASHHCWEIIQGRVLDVDLEKCFMAPFKRAEWDGEGAIRLKWWAGNEKAKGRPISLKRQLFETVFSPQETLILEGELNFSSKKTGLFLEGTADRGTGFFVHEGGLVEYGDVRKDGHEFHKRGHVDRELNLSQSARFRLVRKERITEFYLDDFLMHCYCLPELGTGRISLIGSDNGFRALRAWYCA